MVSLEQIKKDLRSMSTRDLDRQIDLYRDLKSRGVGDEIMLSLYEGEMEHRFLAWEVTEV